MTIRFFTLASFISLSSAVYAEIPCPSHALIQENINTFSSSTDGTITIDGQTWNFESNLNTSNIDFIKSLNTKISDIDEDTCNYLISLTDSNEEDATILLHQRPNKTRPSGQ
jgi:molybdopterin converting factor small subunit